MHLLGGGEEGSASNDTGLDLHAVWLKVMMIPEGTARDAVIEKLSSSNNVDRNAAAYLAENYKVFYRESCLDLTPESYWTTVTAPSDKHYMLPDGRKVSVARGQNVSNERDILVSENLTTAEAWNALSIGMFGSDAVDTQGVTNTESGVVDLDTAMRLIEQIPAGVARDAVAELLTSPNVIDRNAGIFIAETFKVFHEEASIEVAPGLRGHHLPDGRTVLLAPGQHVTAEGDIILSKGLSVSQAKELLLRIARG
jgi:hypothetical protein